MAVPRLHATRVALWLALVNHVIEVAHEVLEIHQLVDVGIGG